MVERNHTWKERIVGMVRKKRGGARRYCEKVLVGNCFLEWIFFLISSSFNCVFTLSLHCCRPSNKKWIDNENIQSQPCFQEGNNQAQPCFQESGISFTAAFSIYKDCSNQYWTSELIADFSEDTHKIDCDWSRIKTSFNPTLAPKCTLQLYCDTSPSKF